MAKKKTMDMTEGNIVKLLLMFTFPIVLGQILQNLYNSFDAIVVGRNVGTEALAAVTACSDISQMIVGFFTGLSTGSGVLFSRYFGAKDYDNLHKSIHTALLLAFFIGLTMAGVGIIFAPQLLHIVNCPDDVYGSALIYLRIYLIGVLFTALYNVGSGVLRAVGDSKRPLYYLAVSSVTNIILDYLFVVAFKMGVLGVAAATIISQLVSLTFLAMNMMRTEDVYKVVLTDLKVDGKMASQIFELGIPAAIQSCLTSISNLFVQRYINSFGKQAMAGIGAAKKIDKFVGLAAQSMGQATTTFVSQNYGALKFKRAGKGVKYAIAMNLAYIVVVSIPVYFFAPQLISLFTKDATSISYGAAMVGIMCPMYFLQVLNQIYSGATRGYGKSRVVMVLSLLGMIGMRQIFLAVSMNIDWNVNNVFIGYPVGWFFSAFFVMIYYYLVIYRKYHKLEIEEANNNVK